MTEEVHVQVPTSNGEQLRLAVGTKSFALTTKDLLSVLLLLGVLGGVYLLSLSLDRRLTVLTDQTKDILQFLVSRQEQILTYFNTHQLRVTDALHKQDQMLLSQTGEVRQLVQDQTDLLRKWLSIMSYNTGRPAAEQLPLETPVEHLPRRPER